MTNVNNVYKVISIWPNHVGQGIESQFRTVVDFGQARFFAVKVGEEGRGRVRRFIPVVNCPAPAPSGNLRDWNIHFIRLRQGRSGWIGEAVHGDPEVSGSLVLLDLDGGFRGYTAEPTVLGAAQVIETGWYAQGQAGRAGRHPQVMMLATGPARVEWHRSGRLYGGEADWVAWTGDGLTWHCMPRDRYETSCDIGLVPDAVMRLGGEGQA